jgi:soluble lytic murein transglycosylase-like protein
VRRTLPVVLAFGLGASAVSADTLYLRSGKALKVEALRCDASTCVATFAGGEVEVRASDVARLEPDEETDAESANASSVLSKDPGPRTVEQMVGDAARRYALPRSLVRAVARAESALDPLAVSPRGARGVMQLMPGTARERGVGDPFDPAQNIDAGARLLRQLLEKYDGRVAEALAAYNAGAGAVARHRGIPPYRETRGYIRKVVGDFEKAEKQAAAPGAGERKR